MDRAFAADPAGEVLLTLAELHVPGPHNVVNALAAAALARAVGVPADAVGRGLAGFRGGAHRNVLIATVDGVDYVDDSKATNPHAAGPRWRPIRGWCGSPAGCSRVPTSIRWSRRWPRAWPGWSSWAAIGRRSRLPWRDTPRRSPW